MHLSLFLPSSPFTSSPSPFHSTSSPFPPLYLLPSLYHHPPFPPRFSPTSSPSSPSPVLFTLYTKDCRSTLIISNRSLLKYVDDMVISGKITSNDCSDYLTQVHLFVEWCETICNSLSRKLKRLLILYPKGMHQIKYQYKGKL